MSSITVPADLAGANIRLGQLDRLATATGWERAAIVWAYVEPDQGNGGREVVGPDRLSARDFARQGVVGLASHGVVNHYRAAWQAAIDRGEAQPAIPGGTVQLPTVPFPPSEGGRQVVAGRVDSATRQALAAAAAVDGTAASRAVQVAGDPAAMATAIRTSPAVAKAAREALRDRDRLDDATTQAAIDQAGRRAGRAAGRALGIDLVSAHLRAAAAELGQAVLELDLAGGECDQVQVAEA